MSLVAFTTASIGLASTPVEHSTGTAYDAKGRALYTETHWSTVDGGETRRLVLFTCADGKPFARKQVNDAGQPLAPLFALDDARFGMPLSVAMNKSSNSCCQAGCARTRLC